ncbi:hypothetical protein IW261DRAFT_1416341 [Armillaria novae-zelandiae]|uniref:TFIIS N-terminal domain-containing protein n=1 Tax=Armillaria novae-zelandiae TaxID=153914 RepID=A0AA39UET9_9AGAR|nr:hypothetical protein IW261DRAFT_1416341 [Armillaria novae-zelandiae]
MSQVLELKKHAKQLQSSGASEKELTTVLQILKKDYQVNEALLRESRVGLAVGKLRTHASKAVSDLAKDIVKKWKNDVEKAKQGHHSSGGTSKPVPNGKPAPIRKASVASDGKPAMQTANKANTRSYKTDGLTIKLFGEETRKHMPWTDVRLSCVRLQCPQLKKECTDLRGTADAEYKGKIRSLFVNLRDKGNPSLREGVISGDVPADKLATMTSEVKIRPPRFDATCSPPSRKWPPKKEKPLIAKFEIKTCSNLLAPKNSKRRQKRSNAEDASSENVSYRQAQTRSADEPMTTFVTCTNCGNSIVNQQGQRRKDVPWSTAIPCGNKNAG